MKTPSSFLVFAISLLLTSTTWSLQTDRAIRMFNEAGVKVEIYWINPQTRAASLMSAPHVYDGAQFPLNSFVGHEFEVREVPNLASGACSSADKVCHSTNFIVTDHDNQVIKIKPGLEIVLTDTFTAAKEQSEDVIATCHANAKRKLASNPDDALVSIDELSSCVEEGVAKKLELANEEISFQAKIRTSMAGLLENYTCVDASLTSTPDVSSHNWVSDKDQKSRLVSIKHDRPSSQIHVVSDFIDEEECLAMETEARKTLHSATVADGKGGSRLSENRKAMQAGISVQWDKETDGDAIARLSRRVYDYTNKVLGLDIEEFGQEDLMSIQYFGRGRNDTEPDRYTPHCDGDCTGLPHKSGTRMATMVMYCTLPSEGGSTNFRNSGVHVKPVAGNAIFFSYINPDTKMMDRGFSEHSGCPVYEGEKKIVTQWIRLGVDAENPWNSFNTLGIKLADAENQ
eukprot:CAMPEP_0119012334 /NCGR_PEP_ID=MMETSP1176-20130426/6401_1 /TAXON_ID=265551 /ORGANISM="Synedropsis recta cf, Strain CCMP1620" /LENGTH=456 /DNA_ID=CAMNT_0006965269 /DNA_START=13 /DNA_END=1383 /DNA_ORIENTATION=-